MTLAPLDQSLALIIVDLQESTAPRMPQDVFAQVVTNSDRLAAAFRASGHPVTFATVDGSSPGRTEMTKAYGVNPSPAGGDTLVPALTVGPDDSFASRAAWSAFAGTDLHESLSARGVTQVVLTGVATSIGVESTARDAYALGYSVAVVADAVTDFRPDVGDAHLREIFPLLAEVTTTDELLTLLD